MKCKVTPLIASLLFLFSGLSFSQTFVNSEAQKIVTGSRIIKQDEKTKSVKYIQLKDDYFYSSTNQDEWLHKSLKFSANHGLKAFKKEIDKKGFTHTRYQVYYKNIPIEGSIYIVHSKEGRVHSANGEYILGSNISVTPEISEEIAFEKAVIFAGAGKYLWEIEKKPRPVGTLTLLPTEDSYVLTYKFDIYVTEPLSRQYIFVNAMSGEITKTTNRIHIYDVNGTAKTMYNGNVTITTDSYSGYYRLRETGRGNGIETYNLNHGTSYYSATDFVDTDNNWTDTIDYNHCANDAHFATEATYDYYYSNFGRNSYDNNGSKLLSYVHYSNNYVNAFWDGTRMTYGDGDGVEYLPLTPIEVVSHEITHGVTEHSANLTYSYESGALNESFSDIFGIVIDFIKNPATANYLMGDAMSVKKTPFRSMQNPNEYGDPDTYLGLYWKTGSADNGGVHSNSGVQNFWFYLLSEGGIGVNDLGNSYNVNGIGREKAAQIAYRNLTIYLTPSSNYSDARYYSIQAAIDLFGDCSPEVASVTDAWHAVGIGNPYTSNIIANYISSKINACSVPATICFYNKTSRASSYLWDFGDNTTDTARNPIHTYNAAGNYTVRLVASGNTLCNTSDTIEKIISVSSGSSPTATTCTPFTQTPGASGIFRFKLNSIDNITNGSIDNYQDYTCTDSTTVIEGKKYGISIKVGNNVSENVYVWADLNNNGLFTDSGELIFQKKNVNKICNDSVIIPGGAVHNTPLRLRVASDAAPHVLATACSNTVNGQVQDYTILIKQNISAPIVSFDADKLSIVSGDTVQFSDRSLNVPTAWNWSFPGGKPATSAVQNPKVMYDSPGTYDVTLIVSNSYGADTLIIEDYIEVTTPAPAGLSARVTNRAIGEVTLSWMNSSEDNVYEDFEDGVADNFEFSDNSVFSVNNGFLNAQGNGDNTWKSAMYTKIFQDFTLEYTFMQQYSTGYSVGTFIRATGFRNASFANGYLINILSSGNYSVWKLSEGIATNILPWATCTAINTSPGALNIVTIEAIGSNIKIYVNSQYVNEFDDDSFSSGYINLVSYFGSGYTHDVHWDNFNIIQGISKSKSSNLAKSTNSVILGEGSMFRCPDIRIVKNEVPVKGLLTGLQGSNVFNYFKVFRDSLLLATTTNLNFKDTLPKYGTYNYWITSKYDSIETESTNVATVNWAVPNPGEICENAQNLKELANPYSSSTFGYLSDFKFCSMGTSPDRIFYIDVPSKYALQIGQTFNDFNSKHAIRIGGACPGTIEIACIDDPDIQMHKYTNTSDSTQRVYFILSGFGSAYGNFTIGWKLEVPAKPKAEFTASKTFFVPGTLVNFTDNSTGVPASWKWYFSGGTPSTSTLQNPSVLYSTVGEYEVKLVVTNHVGSDSITKTRYITVSNLIYCTSNLGGQGYCPGDITGFSITGTTFNNTNHTNCSTTNNSTYGSYLPTGSNTATLNADTTYEFSVTTSRYNIISVWIDYNQNGMFEASEWNQVTTYSTPNVASKAKIPIPAFAKNGKTGMRIRTNYYYYTNGASDACSYFSSGITEDYFITIVNTPKKPTADFSANSEIMVGQNVQFTDLSRGLPTSWGWSFPGGTPSSSSVQNPSVKYNTAGTYNVKLVVKNALGEDSITKTNYITVTTSLPGEDCSSAQNLANLTSPYSATTIGYRNDFSTCGYNSPDRIFFIDVPAGNTLKIGFTYTNYDAMHSIRVGGSCPGSTIIVCTDSDIQTHTYTNSSGVKERIYFIAAGWSSYSGNFTLAWELLAPSIPVANFAANDTSLVMGTYVYFTDQTTGMPSSWNWSFPGGSPSTSVSQNPSVYYSTPGTYNVRLIASNSLGADTLLKTAYIKVTLPPKPVANFSAGNTNVTVGSYVYFYDNSTNYPTSRKWTFEGGTPSTSTYSSPSIRYNTPGIYSVKLVVSNAGGSDSITKTNYIIVTVPPKPVANFYANNTIVITGSYTYFYDNSTNNPTSRKWTFSGGSPSTSTSSNPYVYYYTPGTYDVKLVVTNAGGSDSITKVGYITVTAPPKPIANFYAYSTNIYAGNSIRFYDNSSNSPTSWNWTFSGGTPSTSTSSSPYINYNSPGTYDVKLVVTNAGGSDSITKTGYITVSMPPKPIANFYSSNTNILVGSYVEFYDNSSNSPTSRKWTFTGGTPSTSTSSYSNIQYNSPGVYDVKLVVSNAGGSDSLIKTNYITVTMPPKPVANFSSSTTNTTVGTTIIFNNYSTNSPTSYKWTFTGGSPSTSTYIYPSVVYNAPGTYDVKLVVSNAAGSDSLIRKGYITITPAPKPVANFYASSTTITSGSYTYFYDISSNNPTSWKWTFTGGSPASYNGKYPPSVYYAYGGTFTVKLVATNSSGSDSLIRTGYITVLGPAKPYDFDADTKEICKNGTVIFTSSSSIQISSYFWNFGDGASPKTATTAGPHTVTYSISGSKRVSLRVNSSDSVVKDDYIIVKPQPATPIISQNHNILVSSDTIDNQWYLLGTGAITGANFYIYEPSVNGNYYTITSRDGCPSQPSNIINFVADTKNDISESNSITLFPNPTSDLLKIKTNNGVKIEKIEVRNVVGRLAVSIVPNANDDINTISLSGISAGVYTVLIYTDKGVFKYKVLKI
jgi:PKD repeat protein